MSFRPISVIPAGAARPGEPPEQFMRRVAREKPGAKPEWKCAVCGQDHRFDALYWPEGELARHNAAALRAGPGPMDLICETCGGRHAVVQGLSSLNPGRWCSYDCCPE